MNIGDKVKLKVCPVCQDLGLNQQIGVVKVIDVTCRQQTVLIHFPDIDVYTSAIHDNDVEVVGSDDRPAPAPARGR